MDLAVQAADKEDSWDGLVSFLEHATQLQAHNRGLRDILLHRAHAQARVAQAKELTLPAVTSLVERAQREGTVRSDFVASDIPMIELMLGSVAAHTSEVNPDLWRRSLGIVLDGICAQRSSHRVLPIGPSSEAVDAAHLMAHRRC